MNKKGGKSLTHLVTHPALLNSKTNMVLGTLVDVESMWVQRLVEKYKNNQKNQPPGVFYKKVTLKKISQYSQENNCVGVPLSQCCRPELY